MFAKTGRDALFVQGRGLYDLPKAYMGSAILAMPLASVALFLLKAFGPRTVRLVLPVLTAVALLWFSAVVRPGGGLLMIGFFMFVPLMWGVIFSMSWLLAWDLLDGTNAKITANSFSLIGGAAILGGVLAGLVARLIAPRVEPSVFLGIAASSLLIAALLMAETQRCFPTAMAPSKEPSRPTKSILTAVVSSPYALTLLGIGMAAGLVGVLIEFQFYIAAASAGGSGRDNAAFFADYFLALNGAALAVQLWMMPRVQHRIGVEGSLPILPMALVGGGVGLAIGASLAAASTVRVTEGGLKSSIHRANWEQTFLRLAGPERAVTKVVVDGIGTRLAEGVGALILLGWLRYVVGDGNLAEHGTRWIAVLILAGSFFWVLVTRKLRRAMQQAQLNAPDAPIAYAGLCPDA